MTDQPTKPEGFCTDCGITIQSFAGLNACPNCGTTSKPCMNDHQVTISINWHELRILAIWAENYANQILAGKGTGTVKSIAQRIEAQHPGRIPLTLSAEIQQLKDNPLPGMGEIRTNVPGVE